MAQSNGDDELRVNIERLVFDLPRGRKATIGAIMRHVLDDRKQHELDARKDQTFKVIKSLVKSGSISDSSAAHVLALQTTLIDAELKAERESLGG